MQATISSLVYIAGYVTRKDGELSEEQLLGQTFFYSNKHGKYLNSLDRGLLKIPTDDACQWTIFAYIMFCAIKDETCRMSLISVLMFISEYYSLES